MNQLKGEKLYVALGASKVRKRLKGFGFGVRKVYSDGRDRAVIIHTATGEHLRKLEKFFRDVLIPSIGQGVAAESSDTNDSHHM